MSRDVFILGGKRTAMGEYVGALKDISAIDLGATAAKGALAATNVQPEEIDHTVMGNALQTSGDAIYGARHVALKAGVPFDRPALTVNRLCGSGIQSIVSGAQMIQLGEAQTVLAGGMESMSQAPHVIRGARSGFPLGGGKLEDSLMVALLDTYCNTPMAGTAENLARKFEISREEQDEYALRSQQEAKRAQDAGYLAEEIVPVEVKSRRATVVFDAGRSSATGNDNGRTGKVKAGFRERWICDSGERLRNCRRCSSAGYLWRRVCETTKHASPWVAS